jgi:hypothetical protein
MKGSFAMDMASLDKLSARIIEDLKKEPGASELITPEVASLFTSMKDFWKGTGAMSMDVSGQNISPEYDLRVPSEEKLLESLERMGKLMAPGSPIANLYKTLGLEPAWSMQKNVREHAKVPVHRVEMVFQPSPGAPSKEQAEAMKTLVDQRLEIAVVGDRAVWAGAPATVDGMIDRALAKEEGEPLPITAMQVFGKARQVYLDYDIVGVWAAMAKAMSPDDPTAAVLRKMSRMPSGAPMTFAGTFGEGRSLLQMRLPMAMVENAIQASMDAAEAGK